MRLLKIRGATHFERKFLVWALYTRTLVVVPRASPSVSLLGFGAEYLYERRLQLTRFCRPLGQVFTAVRIPGVGPGLRPLCGTFRLLFNLRAIVALRFFKMLSKVKVPYTSQCSFVLWHHGYSPIVNKLRRVYEITKRLVELSVLSDFSSKNLR